MTPSLIVVSLGAIAAVAGTVVLAARCAKAPRTFLLAWTAALFGLAVALAGQTVGDLAGYSGTIFRAMELGGQAIAPLALCLALVELAGTSVPARFLMRLAVAAIAIIVLVILGTDPLNPSAAFSTAWPDPALYYELVPNKLIELVAAFTMATAVFTALIMMIRSSQGRERAELAAPTLATAGAAALLALPGIAMAAHLSLPAKDLFAASLALAAGTVWYAARAADHRGLIDEPLRAPADHRRSQRTGGQGYEERGYQERGYEERGYETPDLGQPGYPRRPGGRYDTDQPGTAYPGLAALAAEAAEPGAGYDDLGGYGGRDPYGHIDRAGGHYPYDGLDRTGDREPYGELDPAGDRYLYGDLDHGDDLYSYGELDPAGDRGPYADPDSYGGVDRTGDHGLIGGQGWYPDHEPGGHGPGQGSESLPAVSDRGGALFGQITIYTLLDDRTDDFDRLTRKVVEQVRAKEPGTLAYIVHAVPTAPLQRILYEVYRDRDAYAEHLSRPYVTRYDTERRRCVLATNVIELGLQQAKVSPFPTFSAISDILSESGIDLTGVTRSSRRGQDQDLGRTPWGSGAAPADGQDDMDWRDRSAGSGGHRSPGYGGGEDRGWMDDPGRMDDRGRVDDHDRGDRGYEGWTDLRREDSSYQ